MTLVIMTEDGPVDEALLNGYSFGDRILEDVMFRIRIKDGEINCPGVAKSSQRYMDSFTSEQVAQWQVDAEEDCRGLGDNLETADGREAWIENSEDQPISSQPRVVGKVTLEDMLSRLITPKTG